MKIFIKQFVVFSTLFLGLFTLSPSFALAEKIEDLQASSHVNDYADVLDQPTEQDLNAKLYKLEQETGDQVTVVTVKNMDGDYIEHYAVKLFEAWKIGDAKADNGVLFLMSKDDRSVRIEVGYGLEPILTDGWSKYILDNLVIPEFKNGNYQAGIINGTDKMVEVVTAGGKLSEPTSSKSNNQMMNILANIFPFLIFFGLAFFQWLASILGRTKSWWLGGVLGGFIGGLFLVFLGLTLVWGFLTAVFIVFGLIFDFIVSKNYGEHKRGILSGPPDWWSGGTWGPGGGTWTSSSGGSFGGFGGGSSGGGGSSSSW